MKDSLRPSKGSVNVFFAELKKTPDLERALLIDETNCWCIWILTEDASNMPTIEDLDIWMYKDACSSATHLITNEKKVELISYSDGLGVASLACDDLNQNDVYDGIIP